MAEAVEVGVMALFVHVGHPCGLQERQVLVHPGHDRENTIRRQGSFWLVSSNILCQIGVEGLRLALAVLHRLGAEQDEGFAFRQVHVAPLQEGNLVATQAAQDGQTDDERMGWVGHLEQLGDFLMGIGAADPLLAALLGRHFHRLQGVLGNLAALLQPVEQGPHGYQVIVERLGRLVVLAGTPGMEAVRGDILEELPSALLEKLGQTVPCDAQIIRILARTRTGGQKGLQMLEQREGRRFPDRLGRQQARAFLVDLPHILGLELLGHLLLTYLEGEPLHRPPIGLEVELPVG